MLEPALADRYRHDKTIGTDKPEVQNSIQKDRKPISLLPKDRPGTTESFSATSKDLPYSGTFTTIMPSSSMYWTSCSGQNFNSIIFERISRLSIAV